MSIWPIEEVALKPGEVVVSREQFAKLALLAEQAQAEVISDEEFAERALLVEPSLQRGRVNKLIVRSPQYVPMRICF